MRVLLLTQLFQPEPNHLKGLKFAKAVRAAGVDLRVLTGYPNYPGGRLYPGYRMWPVSREVLEGVPVTRVAMFPSHDRSVVRRAATYTSFSLTAAIAACVAGFKPDIVHAYMGPVTLALPAALSRVVRRSRVLLDVQDLWPESATAAGMNGSAAVGFLIESIARWAYQRGDRFIVLSDGYKRVLRDRGIPGDSIDVIHNWCDESQIPKPPSRAEDTSALNVGGHLQVLYAGNIGTFQALDVVLDAAVVLGRKGLPVEFTLAGAGVELERLRDRVRHECIPGVRLPGPMPAHAMSQLYAAADAVLVHLRDDPLSRVAIPQKTQMCLASGRPVLIGVKGDATALVEKAGAGVAFDPGSGASLAAAIEQLAALPPQQRRRLGDRGRQFYADNLSFEKGVASTLATYAALAGSPSC